MIPEIIESSQEKIIMSQLFIFFFSFVELHLTYNAAGNWQSIVHEVATVRHDLVTKQQTKFKVYNVMLWYVYILWNVYYTNVG